MKEINVESRPVPNTGQFIYRKPFSQGEMNKMDTIISRTWHGIVPIENREAFEKYEYQTGIKDAAALPGNRGAYLKVVNEGRYSHFFLCTKWDSTENMIVYAGKEQDVAITYPDDEKYGLIADPIVIIQDVMDDGSPF